ncbi:MAG TPA: DUF1284 domain-containing protein [Clostridia bacterium]|nr:DUF1284 domain-containing protein [Clostridia bacterium]
MINLRPHHILCTRFFNSDGYSKDFILHMGKIVALLNEPDQTVNLVLNEDDVCLHCPNNKNGCFWKEKVNRYDAAVLKKLNLKVGELKWKNTKENAYSKIKKTEDLAEICGDCEWFSWCGSQLE